MEGQGLWDNCFGLAGATSIFIASNHTPPRGDGLAELSAYGKLCTLVIAFKNFVFT